MALAEAFDGSRGRDSKGWPEVTCVVKATYRPDERSGLTPTKPGRLLEQDEHAGEPARSGLLRAAELGPRKPRTDVLLAGKMRFAAPTTSQLVGLEVGKRINKPAQVGGARTWAPGLVRDVVPGRPQAITEQDIAWETTFGGSDPVTPEVSDPRNPAGSGVAADVTRLIGTPAPSLELLDDPVTAASRSPARHRPIGFGPIAPHWKERGRWGGTHDATWKERRAPLLPTDFDRRFFNAAPEDQQLDGYLPGEPVTVLGMTPATSWTFALPELAVPVIFLAEGEASETTAQVDTVIIEPAEAREPARPRIVPPHAYRPCPARDHRR